MRKSTAPSQCFGNSSFTTCTTDDKPSNVLRSTTDLLNLLRKTENEKNENILHTEQKPSKKREQSVKPFVNNESNAEKFIPNYDKKRIIFNVLWGKPSTKKHKTWEEDGCLEVNGKTAVLKDMDGKILAQVNGFKHPTLEEGSIISVGGKQVMIVDQIMQSAESDNFCFSEENVKKRELVSSPAKNNTDMHDNKKIKSHMINFVSPASSLEQKLQQSPPLTMPVPDSSHQWEYNIDRKSVTNVQLDPFLSTVLRPHQKQGLTFLYSCVVGLNDPCFTGAILADEMGLGKTLQCICLIWMLLRSGPYGNEPLLKRVLIVTPSSLVNNWLNEFKKWLNPGRLNPFAVNKKQKPSDYLKMPRLMYPVMIISYEMFVIHFTDIEGINFDLIICDEGHRLKNSSIRAATLLNQLKCKRRILLTGTPIQNNLQEYFSLIDFVNPGFLGSQTDFKKYYEEAIVRSNQPDCAKEVYDLGKQRAKELFRRTSSFILLRTQQIISNYLPTKQDVVVFCIPSAIQAEMYKFIISYWENRIQDRNGNIYLSIITALKKLCNHPQLLTNNNNIQFSSTTMSDECIGDELKHALKDKLCSLAKEMKIDLSSIENGGKLIVLNGLLNQLSKTKEKVVLVSYFTQTLDMLEKLCSRNGYKCLRLDGFTPVTLRSQLVDQFNSSVSEHFIFLLSAKAGGVGLNLIGASRLVLYDVDWNPASDLQAMSRIWRDGQKRNVYIYRLLTAGTIEEKIYQRQISKTHLSNAVVDINNTSHSKLSRAELKDLLEFKENVESCTHDLLLCDCDGCGVPELTDVDQSDCETKIESEFELSIDPDTNKKTSLSKISELMKWEHFRSLNERNLEELCLQVSHDSISFLFRNKSIYE